MIPYLETFFEEKDLIEETWEMQDSDGTTHVISTAVVLEHIGIASVKEQETIADVIRKIDYFNVDINHFFQYLANAIIVQFGQVKEN